MNYEIYEFLDEKSTVFTKVLAQWPIRLSREVPTAGVTPEAILINPDFMASLPTVSDRAFIVAHECEHILQSHIDRFIRRKAELNPLLWNVAADFNANNTLIDEHDWPPPEGLLHGEYRGWQTEMIYKDLLKKGTGDKKTVDDHGGWSGWGDRQMKKFQEGVDRLVDGLNQSELADLKKQLEKQRAYGNQAGGTMVEYALGRLANAGLLQRLIMNKSERDVTWRQPSRRMAAHGIYLPSKQRERVKICIVVDTSGSTQGPLLQTFVNSVRGLLRSNEVTGHVIHCDSEVHRIQPLREFNGQMYGGGGTDFAPGIAAAERMGASLIMYFTDLEGSFPSGEHRVVWVVPRGAGEAPFGRTVRMF